MGLGLSVRRQGLRISKFPSPPPSLLGKGRDVNLLSKKLGEKTYPPPNIGFDLYLGFVHDLSF